MLSTAFLIKLGKKENYEKMCACNCPDDGNISNVKTKIRKEVIIFVILVILDISLLIYTLYCLMSMKLQWYITLILIGGMFLPGVGFGIQIAIIGYYTFGHRPVNSTGKPFSGAMVRNKLG